LHTAQYKSTAISERSSDSEAKQANLQERGGHGGRSEGVVDGGDERGRRGGAQGPGGALPLELRAAVHPPGRQGQRSQLRAGQEAGAGAGGEEAGGQGRGGGVEDGHVPQLLGP